MATKSKAVTVRVAHAPAHRHKGGSIAGRVAAYAAQNERHRLSALVAAAALGMAVRQGMAVQMPVWKSVGLAGTYGLAAWAGAKFTKSRALSHAATGLLSIAVYELAAGPKLFDARAALAEAVEGSGGGTIEGELVE